MTKKEVQQRVLQNGKPLSLDKFEWDEKTKTFSSNENDLVLDFKGVDNLTINCRNYCTINCRYYCTINCMSFCTINCESFCTINPKGDECVVVRRDVYEIIEIPDGKKIRLNEYGVKGYKVLVKKPKKVVLTMDEIAEKFGVDVKNLKIKKYDQTN